MTAGGRDLGAHPDRSIAIVRAFRRPLSRSIVIGVGVAIFVAPLLTGARFDLQFDGTIGIVAIGLLGGLAGVVAAILTVPPRIRRAFEAYSWLGHDEVRRFRQRTGAPVPVGRAAMDRWLGSTPSTPAMRLPRIELLAFVGRYDEARSELEAVPATDRDVRFEIASLRQYIDWLEHDASDVSELHQAARELPAGSSERQAADVTLALVDARMRLVRDDVAWFAPLEQVRGALGWAPWRATLLDTWRSVAGLCTLAAIIATVVALVPRSML
jgi:hypothetical protein